jgi:acyl carrier protein
MTPDDVRKTVIEALKRIAPEIDAATLDAAGDIREQFDIDSMDFLNLMLALHARLGVDIPEVDYPRLTTLNDAVDYLTLKLSTASR